MSLDDKLKAISFPIGLNIYDPGGRPEPVTVTLSDDVIAEIKQAFAEAGYLESPITPDTKSIYAPTITNEHRTFMTGQEWYNRFEKEYDAIDPDWEVPIPSETLAAAKRAAGLTDEPEEMILDTGFDHIAVERDDA